MHDQIVIARQAIFDASNHIMGFELLHRSMESPYKAIIHSDTAATLEVMAYGIDMVLASTKKNQQLFINFPSNLLFEEKYLCLDNNKFVLELLENEVIDDDLYKAIEKAKTKGYRFALDDVGNPHNVIRLLPLADYIKMDFKLLGRSDILTAATKYLHKYKINLLAEKVETYESVDLAKRLGYKYFQGFFFSIPQIFRAKPLSSGMVTNFNLMHEINRNEQDYDRIANIIASDAILSYKLLRFVNSPFYGQLAKITSIKRALMLLGDKELRQWLHISLLSRIATTDIDRELIYLSAFRSKFLSQLREIKPTYCTIELDMCLPSLFSLLDVLLSMPFEAIFEQIPCFDAIKDGLTNPGSPCRQCLQLVNCFEKNENKRILEYKMAYPDIAFDQITNTALIWAQGVVN